VLRADANHARGPINGAGVKMNTGFDGKDAHTADEIRKAWWTRVLACRVLRQAARGDAHGDATNLFKRRILQRPAKNYQAPPVAAARAVDLQRILSGCSIPGARRIHSLMRPNFTDLAYFLSHDACSVFTWAGGYQLGCGQAATPFHAG